MQTPLKALALACALIATSAQAAIINVNNATPSPGEYTDLQMAHDAATAGDTLYLAPTNLTYGNLNVSKTISLIGPGWNVSSGVLGAVAKMGDISFTADVDNFRAEGIQVEDIIPGSLSGVVNYENHEYKRLIVTGAIDSGGDGLVSALIEGCVFLGDAINIQSGLYTNLTIRNNVFYGYINSQTGSNITHNVFIGNADGSEAWFNANQLTDCTVSNNIFINRDVSNTLVASTVIAGNVSFGGASNTFPSSEANLEGIDPLFVAFDIGVSFWQLNLQLQGSSPLIGAGAGGEDIGLYGGEGVYRQDGEPTIPIVRQVNIPGGNTVPANATFDINIISEAHE